MSKIALTAAAAALLIGAPLLAQHAGHHDHAAAAPAPADAIAAAVSGPARNADNKKRDIYRHPAETLSFFEVKPTDTVVEFIPGGGWFTEILAPLTRDHGQLYALQPAQAVDKLKAKLDGNAAAFDKVKIVPFPALAGSIPDGSVDKVLTFRNVHNLVMNDAAPATFASFYAMLKPGGILGIEDHRLPESRDSALEKSSGYLKVSTVRKLAEAAGFELVAQSEINANPKDTADWAKGVWTLPPSLANGETDRAKYLAIGESDRMTLKFRKPVK